jgi:hypothetical protein
LRKKRSELAGIVLSLEQQLAERPSARRIATPPCGRSIQISDRNRSVHGAGRPATHGSGLANPSASS